MVRASVASLACSSAAVITAAFLAGREERSPVLVAANGGFAVAAAIFATASAEAALRYRDLGASRPPRDGAAAREKTAERHEALRGGLDRIAAVAQAGTIGDASAAQYAFAMIVRYATECSSLLDRS